MKEKLIGLGWVMYHECNVCGGGVRQYFSNAAYPAFHITTRPVKNTFIIWQNNHNVSGPHYGYDLEKKIEENVH